MHGPSFGGTLRAAVFFAALVAGFRAVLRAGSDCFGFRPADFFGPPRAWSILPCDACIRSTTVAWATGNCRCPHHACAHARIRNEAGG
ncbi:hypothetical protein CEB94_01465 [Streptomyces hawaiiensis]|uniref:Uncharacterized protein n=1 Tax=Streptomyces hawaiiensis TaxID=67305 RepID=A0A6G5R795_9ACTN|nr:hypothetical protein CEB94_01465 [Streptomyces hawaiiensis]